MSDARTDDHLTEYRETFGCGRILLTTKQANGHSAACDQLPEDSLLTREF
jgi:hypothetical protein